MPLIDVQFWSKKSIEKHNGIPKPARGWIAIGNRAFGGLIGCGQLAVAPIAIGNFAVGLLSIGALSLGALSVGGLALGGLAVGGVALGCLGYGGLVVGGFVAGGIAIGYCAGGGLALAIHAAHGGLAWSMNYAQGGRAFGRLTEGAEVDAFFSQHWFFELIQPIMAGEFPQWLTITFWVFIAGIVATQFIFSRWLWRSAPQTAEGNSDVPTV